ncbi:MAG: hypothetical protein JWM21_4357 [Acidobacteria bacterium]|nr:hypothetical protein [Acidobacteriota bacterium]
MIYLPMLDYGFPLETKYLKIAPGEYDCDHARLLLSKKMFAAAMAGILTSSIRAGLFCDCAKSTAVVAGPTF